jgi:hypothetical protein
MSISQRIADYKPARIGGACRTCELLRSLSKKEADALRDALADPKYSNAGLAKILKAEGYPMADSTVRRHRRGECKQ